MRLIEVKEILEGEVISGSDLLNIEVLIGCAADLMSDILAFAKPGALLLTGLTNLQVIRTAEMIDIKAICFVRGKKPDNDIIKLADNHDMILLRTNLTMFESCGRLYKEGLLGLGYLDINSNDRK
jgi:predicted transcriptional regulator